MTDRDLALARAISEMAAAEGVVAAPDAVKLVEDRIAAAIAAGGVVVSDADPPKFWVLVDADGNRACLCTWQDREPA